MRSRRGRRERALLVLLFLLAVFLLFRPVSRESIQEKKEQEKEEEDGIQFGRVLRSSFSLDGVRSGDLRALLEIRKREWERYLEEYRNKTKEKDVFLEFHDFSWRGYMQGKLREPPPDGDKRVAPPGIQIHESSCCSRSRLILEPSEEVTGLAPIANFLSGTSIPDIAARLLNINDRNDILLMGVRSSFSSLSTLEDFDFSPSQCDIVDHAGASNSGTLSIWMMLGPSPEAQEELSHREQEQALFLVQNSNLLSPKRTSKRVRILNVHARFAPIENMIHSLRSESQLEMRLSEVHLREGDIIALQSELFHAAFERDLRLFSWVSFILAGRSTCTMQRSREASTRAHPSILQGVSLSSPPRSQTQAWKTSQNILMPVVPFPSSAYSNTKYSQVQLLAGSKAPSLTVTARREPELGPLSTKFLRALKIQELVLNRGCTAFTLPGFDRILRIETADNEYTLNIWHGGGEFESLQLTIEALQYIYFPAFTRHEICTKNGGRLVALDFSGPSLKCATMNENQEFLGVRLISPSRLATGVSKSKTTLESTTARLFDTMIIPERRSQVMVHFQVFLLILFPIALDENSRFHFQSPKGKQSALLCSPLTGSLTVKTSTSKQGAEEEAKVDQEAWYFIPSGTPFELEATSQVLLELRLLCIEFHPC